MIFNNYIEKIVKGFEFEKGEIVLIHFWGENEDLDIADKLAIEIGKMGASSYRIQQSRNYIKNYYESINEEYLALSEKYLQLFEIADSVIDVITYPIPAPHKDFPNDKFGMYRTNLMSIMGKIMNNKKSFLQLRVPTKDNAMSVGMAYEEYKKRMIEAYDIDYVALKSKTSSLVNMFNDTHNVELHTSDKDFISFSIRGRQWYKDDGMGDLPCGEVYIAPIEDTVSGTVHISNFKLDSKSYENINLEFEKGYLVNSYPPEIMEYIEGFPGDSTRFSEFGIGLNPNINDWCGYSLLDEKCYGTCHIAVGMNKAFGGENDSPLHMDFIVKPQKLVMDKTLINLNDIF